MVQVVDYRVRLNKKGESFISLSLQGDLVMVQSLETGRFYATAKKCSITSTFDEETAKTLIGRQIPGSIQRVESDPYEYTIESTGEVITLTHRYEYLPEQVTAGQQKLERALA